MLSTTMSVCRWRTPRVGDTDVSGDLVEAGHGRIRNSFHWVLDATMGEDRLRNRTGSGPENLAVMRRLARNLSRATPDPYPRSKGAN